MTTTNEMQKIILSAPTLSTDKSPFLISNFYRNPFRRILQSQSEQHNECLVEKDNDNKNKLLNDTKNTKINQYISHALQPNLLNVFRHNDRLWLHQAEGRGTSKRAVASVCIIRGTGKVLVNGKEEIYYRWPLFYNRMDIVEPFYLAGCVGVYDLYISVRGGGPSGQSKAVRLAIARGLVNACPECYNDLQTGNCAFLLS